MARLVCPGCNEPVHDDWRFCLVCGLERPGLYDEDTASGAPKAIEVASGPPAGALVRWRVLDAGIVFGLSLVATFVVAGLVAAAFGTSPTADQMDTITIAGLFANQLSLLGGTVLWLRRYGLGVAALGLGTLTRRHVGVGVLSGLGGVGVSAVVAAIVTLAAEAISGDAPADPVQIPLEQDPTSLVLVFLAISTILLAPLAEELFFRGMLHQALRRRLRFLPAMLISSSVFAVVHVIPLVIPSIFVLAIVLTTMYEREKSLWVPVFAHATFNIVGFGASFLIGIAAR
jgi:membrane protease YdiL (CAAX protease family)